MALQEGGADRSRSAPRSAPLSSVMQFVWRRLLASRRAVVVVALASAGLVLQSARLSDGMDGQLGRWFILRSSAQTFWLVLPLLVALAVGLEIAADRDGFLKLVRARGVSLMRWTSITAATAAGVGGIVAVVPLGAGAVTLLILAPVTGTEMSGALPAGFGGADPLPWLIGASILGGAAMALVAVAVALWSGNRYLTVTLPAVMFSVIEVGPPAAFDAYKPVAHLALSSDWYSGNITASSVVLYWATISVACLVGIAAWTMRRSI